MPDLAPECAALRREIRQLLHRCEMLQAEVIAEKRRADDAEALARDLIGGRAA